MMGGCLGLEQLGKGKGEGLLMDMGFLLGGDKSALKSIVVMLAQFVNILKTIELYTLSG